MGNNESLPPPPPPGQQPPVPPAQPPGPPPYIPPPQQYTPPPYNPAPEYPPTQQMPPAQPYTPPTQAYPQQPYTQPGYPQQGYGTGAPPPKKKNNGLLIGGGIVAVAALVGGVVLFTGGDDDKGGTLGNATTVSVATTVDSTATTLAPETTLSPNTTLNITVPPATDPPQTDAPQTTASSGGEVQTLIDDTNRFSIVLPGSFQTATTSITTDAGISYARIVGSDDLASYAESEDTFGIFVLVGESATAGTPSDVITSLDPGTGVCPDGTNVSGFATTLGNAEVLQLDGCGTGGAYAKVFMAIELPAQGLVVVAVAQGIGPAADSLTNFTKAVFETVQLM